MLPLYIQARTVDLMITAEVNYLRKITINLPRNFTFYDVCVDSTKNLFEIKRRLQLALTEMCDAKINTDETKSGAKARTLFNKTFGGKSYKDLIIVCHYTDATAKFTEIERTYQLFYDIMEELKPYAPKSYGEYKLQQLDFLPKVASG